MASGTYIFGYTSPAEQAATPLLADAEYFMLGNDNWFGAVLDLLDLFVNNGAQDWGAYNMDHMYWLDLPGTGAPVEFRINDWLNPADNSGSLFVDIYVKLH